MKLQIVILFVLLLPLACFSTIKADKVVVDKSHSRLFLKKEGRVLKEFHVVFGANPKGHKQQEGDERTPEGNYILDFKNSDSRFYKSIHISYPNEQDKARARAAGVSPGGLIMIHGQKNTLSLFASVAQNYNWTDGCIAVTNSEMDEIWNAVDEGTPIEILP
jgi:murein L,D-transpeptidase YafK